MGSLSDEFKSRADEYALQRAKFEALRDALGKYGNFQYVNFYDFLDPNNQNWADYTYKTPGGLFSTSQGHIDAGTPYGIFINNIRNAKTIGDVYKQSELWNSYDPLSSRDRARKYFRFMFGGSEPESPTVNEPDPVQTTADGTGGAQGVVTVGGAQGTQTGNTGGGTASTQGAQAGAQAGAGVVKGGTQGSNNGSGGTQGTQGVQAGDTGGTYASSGVPKGGTKTIGYDLYDPNPGNVSLAYVMRNAPEQERRNALINKWNRENGRESVPYVPGTEIPAGSLNRSSSTYASSGIGNGGTYATGEGIKDANGNVLTNPGGDWEYQYALKNPQYGLGMMGKMSDAQRNYLQAVSDDMGYNYNFRGATRFV